MPSPNQNFRGHVVPYETLLTISTVDNGHILLPLYSSRGIIQTLEPIDSSFYQDRTVNAQLVNLAVPRFQKYKSVISSKDQRPPSRDDVWPGREVAVGCAYLLNYLTVGGSPARPVVSGSTFQEGSFTYYQPLIYFLLGKPTGRFDEWQAGYEWSIPMEEV